MNIALLGLGSLGTLMAYHWQHERLFALPHDAATPPLLSLRIGDQLWQQRLPVWQGEPLDWLVVCTKAASALSALRSWQPLLANTKRIVLLQNGMGQQDEVAAYLANERLPCTLWAAISTEGAYRSAEQIVYAGEGKTLIGQWPTGDCDPLTPLLPRTEYSTDIQTALRQKLAINAVINPLTAYYRCLNGKLASTHQAQLLALADEIQGLYHALAWPLSNLRELALLVANNTSANRSSTLQDVLANKATELPYICGFLLAQASKVGYDAPLSRRLYQSLHAPD